MRDEDHGGVDRRELLLEPLHRLHVEVVGRLVEQEQVGTARERARERGAGELSAGEGLEAAVEILVGEAEPAQHRRCVVAPAVAAGVLETGLRLAVAAERLGRVVAARHRLLEPAQLALGVDQVGRAREGVLPQREAAEPRRPLVVQRHARALLPGELAARQLGLADQGAQQRRLAGAVRAREREPVAALDLERDAVEQRLAGELLAERRCDQDCHALSVVAGYPRVVAADPTIQQRSIDTIRALAMDAVQKANAGHPGTAMALAPLAYVLYRRVMRHNPANPDWANRDRFILSAGHACILQYATLHLTGYNLSLEELKRFRQWESRTPGHPEHFVTEGVETTTGPLGQGFANGVGFAIADRFLSERYNRPHHELVDRYVYAICSDGDLMEGLSYEAASIAGHLGLGRLVYFYDDNHITIDGTTSLTFTTEDKAKRFEAQGWHVQSIADSEDVDAIERATRAAQAVEDAPSLIIVRSHIAYGAPKAVDTAKSHGSPLGEAEVAAAKEALGLDPDKHFDVAPEVYEHMDMRPQGIEWEQEWLQRFERWAEAFPALKEDWDADRTGKPRPGWIEALPEFPAGEAVASRDAGKTVMQALKPFTPTMVGGAADLVESTKTEFEGAGLFSRQHAGRNIPFGIREHAMGSIVNGIGLTDGMLKPYGSTFLIFSDYMRPAVRLSALGHMQSLWVWTHDSVGVGEDGPTHQPVEHHMALRAIPNLWYVRPGDANETTMAWRIALEREGGPVALALSRQKLETLDRTEVAPAEGALRGAYTLWQSGDGTPDLLLLATGSELGVAYEAAQTIDANVRVVSMPCWELFAEQPQDYRDEVLPPDVGARLSIEAGIPHGWERWVGDAGASVGIDRFGASAPGDVVLANLGFTAENVAARAAALLERVAG